jgi:IgA Peptidase M64
MTRRDGSVVGVTTVVDHGPSARRFDVVITGDGYRAEELTAFAEHVEAFCARLFATAPFDVLEPLLNVHRLDVASTDSGADEPSSCADGTPGSGAKARTFFDATFCGGGSRRLLTVDTATVLAVATDHVPAYDMVFVQVNAAAYGGSGGSVAVSSQHPEAAEIALHEMGHTAFGLADEYPSKAGCSRPDPGHDVHPGPEPDYPNVTLDPTGAKWAELIGPGTALPTMTNPDPTRCDTRPSPVPPGTVGAFEGADYHRSGVYRPEYDCRMRTLGTDFCAVCQREIRRQVLRYAAG